MIHPVPVDRSPLVVVKFVVKCDPDRVVQAHLGTNKRNLMPEGVGGRQAPEDVGGRQARDQTRKTNQTTITIQNRILVEKKRKVSKDIPTNTSCAAPVCIRLESPN